MIRLTPDNGIDMVSVRRIVVLGMSVAAVSAVVIGCASLVLSAYERFYYHNQKK